MDWSYGRVSQIFVQLETGPVPAPAPGGEWPSDPHVAADEAWSGVDPRTVEPLVCVASLVCCLNVYSGDVEILCLLTLIWVGFSAAACFASLLWAGFSCWRLWVGGRERTRVVVCVWGREGGVGVWVSGGCVVWGVGCLSGCGVGRNLDVCVV